MCVNNLSKVALDSAAAGIEPAISSRKSNALTTAPPSHITAVVSEMMKEFTREKKSTQKNTHRDEVVCRARPVVVVVVATRSSIEY